MALIDHMRQLCRKLGKGGWTSLLEQHGFSLEARDLEREFAKPLPIARTNHGFEDFCLDGVRAIQPGHPAKSFLYHALASPRVSRGKGLRPIQRFPTLRDLDLLENFIYGVNPPSIGELQERVQGAQLAIVVFAYEYRPASQTCHKRHADLVFSRTGIARVGTRGARYVPEFRGFVPYDDTDAHAIRVCPARYGAFIAASVAGDQNGSCPMRFRSQADNPDGVSDANRQFWVPVHKLFPGRECLRDLRDPLQVNFEAHHVNEKLRRIHLGLQRRYTKNHQVFDSGWHDPDLDRPPFRFTAGIARLARGASYPPGLLIPRPRVRLVEPATYKGRPVGFKVPRHVEVFASSIRIAGDVDPANTEVLSAPEYVHARTQLEGELEIDLNALPDVAKRIHAGHYTARHYLDFTADGSITASCPQLTAATPAFHAPIAAYSLVTAPDFVYRCDQRDLTEWTDSLTPAVRRRLWKTAPDALSDQRFPGNLQLPDSPFDPKDKTITAIVSVFGEISRRQTSAPPYDDVRHSHLPDDAAGVFAPGWDVSHDWLPDRTQHLASYGLGSPFPEDMKLCTALATFWPAVAPDSTRVFTFGPESGYRTICPLTDEETGQSGGTAWDGVRGPKLRTVAGRRLVEFPSFDNTDYVANALENRFSLRTTSHISADEYHARVVAMELTYRVLKADSEAKRSRWVVLSFRAVSSGDVELQVAQKEAGTVLIDGAFRFHMFWCSVSNGGKIASRTTRGRVGSVAPLVQHVVPLKETLLFVDPRNRHALIKRRSWRAVRLATL